jgi:D-alanyl-D-alanine carboxypeptidase
MCYKKLWKVAPQFGFIQRYEKGKEKLTGIKQPEPWHYRYVGKETAEYMRKNDLAFEEYHKMQYDDGNTPEV